MANKNNHVVIAYFSDADQAQQAADQIKDWDKATDAIKLGGIGILTWEKGKIKTHKVGRRATGSGAKWGVALGAVTGVLSGGVTLIGGDIDECSMAYKDIESVMAKQQDLVRVLGAFNPAIVRMAGEQPKKAWEKK